MNRVSQALAVLLASAVVAQAAPPVVTVPAEVSGDVGAFVAVRTTVTEAKAVKFVPLDPGINLFPADLLTDKTATVVTSAKPGRYRLLCYSGNADGPSEPAMTTVVIGSGPIVDPKPDPVKPDPKPPTPTDTYYFLAVRQDQNTKAFEDLMKLAAWKELTDKGHTVADTPISFLPAGIDKPATLPSLVVLRRNADGKTWTPAKTVAMPTTDEAIRGLIK